MNNLTHLSLFSGIGGLDLAAEWAGIKTIGQCEWADYPTKVLEKHWPEVARWRDIRTLTKDSFYEKTGLRTVDIVSGGFPCQPFSVAGKHTGKQDDRYLWPEMLRVIKELRPTWVIGENVPGIINLALDTVLSDLENIGYESQPLVIPACAVNAWHKRERVCIVAHIISQRDGINGASEDASKDSGKGMDNSGRKKKNGTREWWTDQSDLGGMVSRLCERMDWPSSDSSCFGLQGKPKEQIYRGGVQTQTPRADRSFPGRDYWQVEPDVDRVVHGVPNRVDRIKCLGNAVVPQQFYPIFKAIAEIERGFYE